MHLLIQKFKLWFNKILFCWNATDDSVIGLNSRENIMGYMPNIKQTYQKYTHSDINF